MVKCANKRYVVITIELMLEYTELKPVLLGAYGIRKCGMLDHRIRKCGMLDHRIRKCGMLDHRIRKCGMLDHRIRKCGMLDHRIRKCGTPVLQNPSETYLVDDRWEIDHVLSVLMGCC